MEIKKKGDLKNPLNLSKYDFDPLYHKAENFRTN
jgi:hypothetical protein